MIFIFLRPLWLQNDLGVKCCSTLTPDTVSSHQTITGAWTGKTQWTTLPTVMGHPNRKALVEATMLALVSILFLNLAATITFVINQL